MESSKGAAEWGQRIHGKRRRRLPSVMQTFCLCGASCPSVGRPAVQHRVPPGCPIGQPVRRAAYFFLGLSIVPVHLGEPQWQAQIFFRRAVCASSSVMP